MQARIFMCDSSDPAPSYERFRFDGIRFYRCTFPAGSHQTYRYPADIAYAQLPSCHIQVSGRMVEPTGVWPDQNAGWISREEQFTIPAGVFTRLAETDTVRWCCTGVVDGESTDFVTPLRLDPLEPIHLMAGDNLLLAEGKVLLPTGLAQAPRRLRVVSGPIVVQTVDPGYAFRWRTADVLERYPASGSK